MVAKLQSLTWAVYLGKVSAVYYHHSLGGILLRHPTLHVSVGTTIPPLTSLSESLKVALREGYCNIDMRNDAVGCNREVDITEQKCKPTGLSRDNPS